MKKRLFILAVLLTLVACSQDVAQTDTSDEDVAAPSEQEQTTYKTITIDEIEMYVDEGYIVADVREAEEYASGHIPGAINAPLSALQQGDFSAFDPNEKYVIICRSGNRSVTASNILAAEGYDIVNVREGMSAWTGEVEY